MDRGQSRTNCSGQRRGAFRFAYCAGADDGKGVLPADSVDEYLVLGELSLDGYIQPVTGTLPACGFHKIPRFARTISDLARSEQIDWIHVLEALSYRRYFLFGAVNG